MFTLALALLYPLAVQYRRGGWWQLLLPLVAVTGIIDVIANYTELALITWDFPQPGEYTFSQRLERLRYERNLEWLCRFLNFCDPTGNHIPPRK